MANVEHPTSNAELPTIGNFVREISNDWKNGAGRAVAALLLLLLAPAAPARADLWGRAEKDATLTAGRAALEDGFYDLAQAKFEAYIDAAFFKRNKARGSLLLAQALFGQGKYAEAATWLEEHRGWASDPDTEGGFTYWLARAQYELGRHSDVTGTLYRFERLYPEDENLARVFRLRTHALIHLGHRERALKSFASFQDRYPNAPEVPDNVLDWARLLIEDNRGNDAEVLLRQVVEQYPLSEAAQSARLWLGRMLMERGQYAQALDLLDALARPPDTEPDVRAEAWASLARIALAQTNLSAAIEAFEQGERSAEDLGLKLENRISRARLLARAGSLDAAVELLQGAVAAAPTHPRAGEAQLELAAVLMDQGRAAGALGAYQSYLEAFTDEAGQARALMGKGWALWRLGRYAEAATVFEKAHAAQREPEARETALLKAADAYFANAQYKLAEEAYRRVLAEHAGSARTPEALYQVGECLARLHEYAAADAPLKRIRREFPADPLAPRAALRMAGFREEQGQWDEAVRLYDEFLKTYAQADLVPEALLRSAQALYRGGAYRPAQERFERVLKEFPDTAWAEQAFFQRGWVLHQLGDSRRGVQVCREFVAKHPESPWAPEVRFWLAEQQFNAGGYADAEDAFQALVRLHPRSDLADDALFWAGRAAAAQSEFRRAIAAYNDLTRTYTNSPLLADARFAQGDALSELGEFSGAILAFDDILRRHPGSPLADRARGRKGDCQFTLGADRPERYQEALASYRSVLDSPTATASLKLQAEFKIGRCYEKLGRKADAFQYYMNVVYGWLSQRDRGDAVEPVWFTRAAFNAAALKEAEQQWDEAVRIYERVRDAGIPAGADAGKRIQKINADRVSALGGGDDGKALR